MRPLSLAAAALLAAIVAACGTDRVIGPTSALGTMIVTPSRDTVSVMLGANYQLSASVVNPAGNVPPSKEVAWTSSDNTVATIDSTGLVHAVALGHAQITVSNKKAFAYVAVTVIPVPVASVKIAPDTITLLPTQHTTLVATTSDSIGGALTGRVISWTSSDSDVVSVAANGVVTAKKVTTKPITITATSEGKSGSALVGVRPVPVASVAVAKPTDRAAYYIGSVDTVSAATLDSIAQPLVGRVVTWTSSAPSVIEITNDGIFTAKSIGRATLTATSEGKSAGFDIDIVPVPVKSVLVAIGGDFATSPLYISNTRPLVVTPRDSADGALTGRVVKFSTSDASIVTADDATSKLTAVGVGQAKIFANVEGVTGEIAVTVVPVPVAAVTLDRSAVPLALGATTTLVATPRDSAAGALTGRTITWASADASVATVDAAGVVTVHSVGATTISATVDSHSASATVSVFAPVTDAGSNIAAYGDAVELEIPNGAVTSPVDLTVVPTPATSLPNDARLIAGSAFDFGPSGTTFAQPLTLTIAYKPAALPAGASESTLHLYLLADGHLQLVAGSHADVATHTVVGTISHFSTYVVATPPAVASVTITPTSASLFPGHSTTFGASAVDADGAAIAETAVAFSSSNDAVATVNATSGMVVAHSSGSATITATAGGKQATASVSVTPTPVAAVEIDQDNQTLYEGRSFTYSVSVLDAEGESLAGRVVSWTSSNPTVASVDPSSGVATAHVSGSATIMATSEGKTGSVTLTVVPVPVAGVEVTPSASVVQVGTTVQLTGVAEDASGNVLAGRSLTWSSSNNAIATVNSSGMVQTVGAGTATIRATSADGAYGEAIVTIEAKTLVINEIMADPGRVSNSNPADIDGEWFEIYNPTHFAIDMKGYRIFSLNDAIHTISTSVIVPAGGYAVFGRNPDQTKNGGVRLDYSYASGTSTINLANNTTDNLVIRDASGTVGVTVDSVINGTSPPTGKSRMVVNPLADNTVMSGSNWVVATTPWSGLSGGDYGTPGAPNSGGVTPPPPTGTGPVATVTISPTSWTMDAGLTKQFTATGRDATGSVVSTTFTWASSDPTIATVSSGGLASGVAAGSATITVTSANGISATAALTINAASTTTGPIYRNHLEFGMPVDADPSDDYILTKTQYVVSYNRNRNLPNWVAWNLNATQLGTAPRCDCFSPDPQLPDSMLHVTTSDYTGSGYDRGHMVTSSQRNYSPAENATTYLMTNILPQAPDNNQGPWEVMEAYLTDLAKSQGKELYIVSGGTWSANSKNLVNSTGVKIPVPDSTWKIVVIMPAGQGLANVTSASSVQVIAAMFPNVQGIRGVDWNTYRTTVRKIEQTTGYNFLSALPDDIEETVETTP